MKYFVWILVGIVCGAALGILGPFGMFLFVTWKDGDRAAGIGTPMALTTLITVPCGAILGAYAGFCRAATGGWTGIWSASRRDDLPGVEEILPLWKSLPQFERELATLGGNEALRAKQGYLQELEKELDGMELNYRLVIATGLLGLLFTPLLIVPLLLVASHFWSRHELMGEMRRVEALGAAAVE